MVGGGIAGLTVAAALDPGRFETVVYEAQPERAGSGAALGVWGSAAAALRRIGVVLPASVAAPAAALFDLQGRRRLSVPDTGVRLVDRPELLRALDNAVPVGVRRVDETVDDPRSLAADLVIGADGVRSRVRPLVAPRAAERIPTPYVTLRGISPGAPDPGTVGEYWGRGLLFGQTPIAGDRTYWFTAHRDRQAAEPLEVDAVLDQARRRFERAAPVIGAVLAGAGPDTLATRIWVTGPMARYVRGRYVVIGDAAHAMTPNLGRGACSAVVDAVTLAGALNSGRDLRWWQARRVPVTQAARVASGVVMRVAGSVR